MNSDQLVGKWQQMKGEAKTQWGKLTDDDLMLIDGQKDKLIGKLQERYGYAKEEAQRRADEWLTAGSSTTSSTRDQQSKQPSQQMGKDVPNEKFAHKR